jgi:CubicO group peptidase (beta-lactamase class C family)
MTASLAALLVEQGHLSWDTTMSSILPELKTMDSFVSSRATIVDFLSHRSGLPRHDAVWIFRGRPFGQKQSLTRSDLVKGIRYLQPSKDFRVEFQYNNLMYGMSGFAVGEIFRKFNQSDCTIDNCWETLIQHALFDKIGMTESFTNYQNFQVVNRTTPQNYAQGYVCQAQAEEVCKAYRKCPDDGEHDTMLDVYPCGPAGSVMSNVNDMTKWMLALLKPNVTNYLTQASVNKLFTGITPVQGVLYAMGCIITQYRGNLHVSHGGQVPGYKTEVVLYPGTNDGYVMFTNHNAAHVSFAAIGQYLNDAVLGLTPSIDIDTLCKINAPVPPEEPVYPIYTLTASAGIAGNFSHPTYGTIRVVEQRVETNYQYQVTLNDDFTAPLRVAPNGLFMLYVNITFSNPLNFPLSFEKNFMTNKVDRIKAPLEPSVEQIVFVNNEYSAKGFGVNIGFGGDGFGFPVANASGSDGASCSSVISAEQWKVSDIISKATLTLLGLTFVLLVILLIVTIVFGVKNSGYQKFN